MLVIEDEKLAESIRSAAAAEQRSVEEYLTMHLPLQPREEYKTGIPAIDNEEPGSAARFLAVIEHMPLSFEAPFDSSQAKQYLRDNFGKYLKDKHERAADEA